MTFFFVNVSHRIYESLRRFLFTFHRSHTEADPSSVYIYRICFVPDFINYETYFFLKPEYRFHLLPADYIHLRMGFYT